ncbi:GtrA family protein [Alicyclobacillus mengziensis]|uniref:GtrA family protein n=1 Tax=Alicyclobacillus mengziensis TaxID=2931921 RepID=A0A9X7W0T2_9BACL|nr:GtrA family protein [Alicyclobacillus mengziensis]QSO47228.1 GtrA family protein [Alicyclobacillus mengziensis]
MKFVHRYTRFLVIGFLNAVIDLLILNGLLLLSPKDAFHIFIDNTIAVICAITNSYFLNRRFTFRDVAARDAKETARFFVQAFVNLVLNDAIAVFFSTYLIFSKSIPVFVSSNISKGLAMFISSSMSYFMMRYMVFRPSANMRKRKAPRRATRGQDRLKSRREH